MKKETLADRLNQAMALRNMSQGALAKASGVAQPTIWRLTSGNAHGSTKIVEIANALGVRSEWLSTGVGPMATDDVAPAPQASSNSYRIEVLDLKVSAGPGTYMLSDAVEVLTAIEFTDEHARALFGSRKAKDIKVMTVDGDSMYPTIKSGDRLFFDVSVREFTTDGVYAFVFGKTFHIKRLQMQGLELSVLSDNPAYKDWAIGEGTHEQLYIMGKALLHESIQYGKL